MTNRARSALLLACLSAAIPSEAAHSEATGPLGRVDTLHAAWQGCLNRNFGLQSVLTSRSLAADSALKACRDREDAYLAALSVSPLVDGEDVARVRPVLLDRARDRLLGQKPSRSL